MPTKGSKKQRDLSLSILDALQDCVCLSDQNGSIVYINKAFQEFAAKNGISLSERLQDLKCLDISNSASINNKKGSSERSILLQSILDGSIDSFSLDYPCHLNGQELWLSVTFKAFPQDEGERFVLVCLKDNTDIKKTISDLRNSEKLWRSALEGSGDGVWDWNVVTNKVFFSTQWKSMLGYQGDEIGDSLDEWLNRVHRDDIDDTFMRLQRHLRGQSNFYVSEHRLLCKDGTYKWILDRGRIIERQPDGTPLRVVGLQTDISKQKSTEASLRENESLLAEAQRIARFGCWDRNIQKNTLFWSDEIYNIFGLPPQAFKATYEAF
ncbi:MAG: PAS domain-containing protein, partial [Thermodesulfovibrionales bacterium]